MKRAIEEASVNTGQRKNFPLPVGGWNAKDPLSGMKPTDAVVMDNLFPRRTDIILRKGSDVFVTCPNPGTGETEAKAALQSFLPYYPVSGSNKLFVASSLGIFDATATATHDSSDIVKVVTSGDWRSINMTTAAGNYLFACNGVDKILLFNGTTWTSLDGTSTPAITGITTTTVINCCIFRNRILLVPKNSLDFYYLPLDSIAGAATKFPLGGVFERGGYIVAQHSWSVDNGAGIDDFLITVTSQGECAIYQGTDPSSLATFKLVGLFNIPKPIGRNCLQKVGEHLFIITVAGLYPLSKLVGPDSVKTSAAISDRISDAWQQYAELYKALPGWNMVHFSSINMLLVNVPITVDSTAGMTYSYQFVLNTETGAWSRFTAQNATAWQEFNDELYFISGKVVNKAWQSYADGTLPITFALQTAYNRIFRNSLSHLKLIKLTVNGPGDLNISLGVNVDFMETVLSESVSSYASTVSIWDTSLWDTATWVGDVLTNSWRTVYNNPGSFLSFRLKSTIKNTNMQLIAIDLVVEPISGLL